MLFTQKWDCVILYAFTSLCICYPPHLSQHKSDLGTIALLCRALCAEDRRLLCGQQLLLHLKPSLPQLTRQPRRMRAYHLNSFLEVSQTNLFTNCFIVSSSEDLIFEKQFGKFDAWLRFIGIESITSCFCLKSI